MNVPCLFLQRLGLDVSDVAAPPLKRSMRQWTEEVARHHRLTLEDLTGPRRFRNIILARHEAMWVIRLNTRNSSTQIGRFFGGRDHTTVLSAVIQHEKRLAEAGMVG